ncbi:type VI secretion system baseplate subunit TssG [Janthinobacterium sp. HH01]|uniref:type VI secretion system baseplate subunit TssG n=1 Tax=Janthinobacterium sp. HH01 TaxID=1198452 RepID=UPI00256FB94C|nr:type VI secretion system baseplate subunit TssG [Janthinobacterium sp. HH01]
MFYLAWSKHRPECMTTQDGEDGFLAMLLALSGAHPGESVDRETLARYAMQIRSRSVSAPLMAGIYSEYFSVRFVVEQLVGQWLPLADADQARLGKAQVDLGAGVILGERIYSCDARVRLRIGPLGRDVYEDFLPGRVELLIRIAAVGHGLFPMRAEVNRVIIGLVATQDVQAVLVGRARIARIDAHAAALHRGLLRDRHVHGGDRGCCRLAALHRARCQQALLGACEVNRLLAWADTMLHRCTLLRAHAGLRRAGAAPSTGAPHGFVFVDIDRIEVFDDVRRTVRRFHAGSLDGQHNVAAVQRFRIDMAVGVLTPQQAAEHLLDRAENGFVVVDTRRAGHAAGVGHADALDGIAAMHQFVLGSVGLGTGFKYCCQCVCHDGLLG